MFIHLHNHSEYSLLDGATRLGDMVDKAASDGMGAVALTDHGNMFGAIEFYKLARGCGLKPIVGFEAYLSKTSMETQEKGTYHLTLLAKDKVGYRNLMYLTTMSYTRGFYYKPRIDKNLLREHSEGLIAGSACLHGEVSVKLLSGDYDGARRAVEEYKGIFGSGNFFLEIMRHGLEEQKQIEKDLMRLSIETNTPLVATNDCHYLDKEHAEAQDALLCIQTNRKIEDENRMRMGSEEFFFKTQEEMYSTFDDCREFVDNSKHIADECKLDLDIGKLTPPHYRTPNGETEEEFLRALSYEGLKRRLSRENLTEEQERVYRDRLELELSIIEKMNFSGYFLIVWDFINYAKTNRIPVGPGRGSAAGSLVSYAIGITDIDPIKYNLLFERFLNPERISMPDIDVDFCFERRDEVIQYVREKYGEYNVAQVITFGTMQAKAVVRDVARVMGLTYREGDKLAKMIPDKHTLEEAVQNNPQLKGEIDRDDRMARLFKISRALEGVKRHASTHAAGVVISERPIYERCPLYKPPNEDVYVTQFSKEYLEDVGLIKFDFLALRNLTVIDYTIRSIGEGFDITSIPLDDNATYELLQSGNTLGVFQLESPGMQRLITDFKPERFEDLIALVALYRPGPLGSGMVKDFIDRKHGRRPIEYPLPELEDILKETYGIILYQEQVMQIASRLAGYSLGEADILRRAMGKKKMDVMEEQRNIFVERSIRNGVDRAKAEHIFDLMVKFAEYGFNKSHSAAYAYIAYQTAYLKTHYTEHFLNALLTSEKNQTEKIAPYIEECRRLGIPVLPPDINESGRDFSVVEHDGRKIIRFGLRAIKNAGSSAIDNIIGERNRGGPYGSIFDFARRVDKRKNNRKVIESLIKAGCFDSLGINRATLLRYMDEIMEWADKVQRQVSGNTLFASASTDTAPPRLEEVDVSPSEIIAYEKELLGIFVSSDPIEPHKNMMSSIATATSKTLSALPELENVVICGVPIHLKTASTRKKEKMGYLKLMDMYGIVEVIVFPKILKDHEELLESNDILVVRGSVDREGEKAVVRAQSIERLSDVRNRVKEISLVLRSPIKESVGALKKLLLEKEGKVPLRIEVVEDGKLYEIQTPYSVHVDSSIVDEIYKKGAGVRLRF